MDSDPPFQPTDRPSAAVDDAIEAWSVFEQYFVLSYRTAPGLSVQVNDLSVRSAAILGSRVTVSSTIQGCSRGCCTQTTGTGSSPSTGTRRPQRAVLASTGSPGRDRPMDLGQGPGRVPVLGEDPVPVVWVQQPREQP